MPNIFDRLKLRVSPKQYCQIKDAADELYKSGNWDDLAWANKVQLIIGRPLELYRTYVLEIDYTKKD